MGLLGRHSIFPGFNASAGRGFHDVCPRTGRDRQVLLSLFQHDAFRIWEFFPRALLLIFAPKARLALLVCLVLSVLANVASWILFASFTAVGLGIFLAQAVIFSVLLLFGDRKNPRLG